MCSKLYVLLLCYIVVAVDTRYNTAFDAHVMTLSTMYLGTGMKEPGVMIATV